MAKDSDNTPNPEPVTVNYTQTLQDSKRASGGLIRGIARTNSLIAFAGGTVFTALGMMTMFFTPGYVNSRLHFTGRDADWVTNFSRVTGGTTTLLGISGLISGFAIWKTTNDSSKLRELQDKLNIQQSFNKS